MAGYWNPFDTMSSDQVALIEEYERLVLESNRRVNLVSRASTGEFRTTHTLHCLALSRKTFLAGSIVVDWGSGGGLPGIPLAIRFPEVRFVLVDSVGRKTDLVAAIARRLDLDNVTVEQQRAEDWAGKCDYAVSRATAPLSELWSWTRDKLNEAPVVNEPQDTWSRGLVALKGGDLNKEISALEAKDPETVISTTAIADFMGKEFETKSIVAVSPKRSG